MHYYQFNIGDYAKSTLHLSLMEDLAYRRLLDRYYDTEKPLESDVEKLCRFIRMSAHKTETQQVLSEFFTLTKKGWIQKRVAKELSVYSLKADTARANGKKGGRPKKTQPVSNGMPIETQAKAKQEPLTINQEPLTNNHIKDNGQAKLALDYFNQVTGRKFKSTKEVQARLKEYSLDDIQLVIDYKSKEWMGSDWQKYLRPETLFNKTKFEGYYNDAVQRVPIQPANKITLGDLTMDEIMAGDTSRMTQ